MYDGVATTNAAYISIRYLIKLNLGTQIAMSREWYVIIGLAKTGTTIVASTLRNTLNISEFLMEPKDLISIEQVSKYPRLVAKIVFDHWQTRVDELGNVVRHERDGQAPTTIAIIRDPRDELVSRLHYAAFPYFSTRPTTEDQRSAWLDIFRRKEAAPENVGLFEMQAAIKCSFGVDFIPRTQLYDCYCRFIDSVLRENHPLVHLLRYEDFVQEAVTPDNLRSLLTGRRDVGYSLRRVHRSGSSGEWHTFLSDSDLTVINNICQPLLERFGYPIERSSALGKTSRVSSSDYVEKLIDEARRQFEKGRSS